MKKPILLILCLCALLAACGGRSTSETPVSAAQTAGAAEQVSDEQSVVEQASEESPTLTVAVGGKEFSVSLEDNDTSRAFAAMLPLTLDMSELNGNEKYFYLDGALPSAADAVGEIEAGDLMLYGDNCVVLFYESFSTLYRYTRIGTLDDASGLREAVGSGSVPVTFE